MNKIFQISLISSVLATCGFTTDVVVRENGSAEIKNYGNGIDVNLEIQRGGSINVLDDATLNEGKTLTLQPGAEGTITSGKTLKNEGTIVMNYDCGIVKGLFSSGGGDIEQKYGEVEEQAYVSADLDESGTSQKWYVYSGDVSTPYLYNTEPGLDCFDCGSNWLSRVWCMSLLPSYQDISSVVQLDSGTLDTIAKYNGEKYKPSLTKLGSIQANFDNTTAKTWYAYELFNGQMVQSAVLYNTNDNENDVNTISASLNNWYINKSTTLTPITVTSKAVFPEANSVTISEYEHTVSKVLSNITINGVDALTYYAQDGAGLVDDTTTLTGDLEGKNPKKIEQSQQKGFSPDVISEIAPIKYSEDNGSSYKTLGEDMSGVSELSDYFASFGVSFKQSDGSTDPTLTYNAEGKSRFEAIASGTLSDAILIDNTQVGVDKSGTIAANLHNIGVESPAPVFSGENEMTLSGDNRLLTNATLDVPVTISGENAIPTDAKFKKALKISESATIPADSEVQIGNALTVDSGKQLSVSGTIVFGTISE